MNYYIIKEDKRINTPLAFNSYTAKHSKTFDDISIEEEIEGNVKLVDYKKKRILFDTRHIFSDAIKEVIETEKGYIESRAIFVSSEKNQLVYWEIRFEQVDCVFRDKQLKLYKDKISKDIEIFKIQVDKMEYLIARFDTVEKIMRNFSLGIKFKLIELI